MEIYKYPYEMMPLMYAILKSVNVDFIEAQTRIDEGEFFFEFSNVITDNVLSKMETDKVTTL